MKLFKKVKKGFTLVELVVVIAVIAILAAVSVGAYFGITESAKSSKLEQEAKQVHTAIQLVGNTSSDNHQLTSSGLEVVDLKKFEDSLAEVLGTRYGVYNESETQIAGNSIVLKGGETNGLVGSKTYKTFEYYTPDTGNAAGVVDVVSGSYSKVVNNDIKVSTLSKTADELKDALKKASVDKEKPTLIKLGASIIFEDHLLIDGKSVILDLNGYTISAKHANGITHDDGYKSSDLIVIHAINGANVVITGDGFVRGAVEGNIPDEDEDYGVTLVGVYKNSTVTIKSGHFDTGEFDGASCLYTKNTGKTIIEGGTFIASKAYKNHHYTLNTKSNDGGTNPEGHKLGHLEFEISGGVFYYDNPAAWKHNPHSDMPETGYNFVKEGYKSVEHADSTSEIPMWEVVKA